MIIFLFLALGLSLNAPPDPELDLDYSPLIDLHVKTSAAPHSHLINSGPATIKVTFTAWEDMDFELDLKVNQHLFHKDAPAHIQRHWTYRGDATLNGWLHGTATFTFETDDYRGRFHGTMLIDDVKYTFQHANKIAELKDSEYSMSVFRQGSGVENDVTQPADLLINPERHESRRRLNLEYFTDCWPDQDKYVKKLSVGYTVDNAFITRVEEYMEQESGSTNEKIIRYVTQVNADSNEIYLHQLDVYLSIMSILFVGEADNAFQQSCPDTINNYLTMLKDWRRSITPNTGGMWKGLTNCYPPAGTVGLAYVGTLCGGSAAGVSNFMMKSGSGTWGVNAHEAGHIFGARHSFENGQGTTGGIMDYGDGIFQGIFQFNPLRKNEICGTLSNTIPSNNNAAANCWSTIGQGEDTTEFLWRKIDDWQECFPVQGNFRTRVIDYRCDVFINGVKVSGSDVECDISDKPAGDFEKCSDVTETQNCGNNIVETGEECEPSIDGECCDASTCQWINNMDTTATCSGRGVDAAFMTNNQVLYLFKGDQVYRYSNGGQTGGLDTGYPKAIQTEWSGVSDDFSSNIGGVVRKQSGNEIYLFKGMNYQVINYESGSTVETSTISRAQVTEANYGNDQAFDEDVRSANPASYSSNFFQNCGGVEAAVGYPDHMWLFCKNFYVELDYNWDMKTLRPVQDLNINFEWDKLRTHISAAYYDSDSLRTHWYNAGHYVDWWAFRSISNMQPTLPLLYTLDGAAATVIECAAHCTTCAPGLPDVCMTCENNYVLWGSRCVHSSIQVSMNWDTGNNDMDYLYLKNGRTQMDYYVANNKISGNGLSGNAFKLEQTSGRTDMVEFAPINSAFSDFKVQAYFKPDSSHTYDLEDGGLVGSRLFTFTDGLTRRISIYVIDPTSTTSGDIYIEFPNSADNLKCETGQGINQGDWNEFSVEFKAGEIKCCVQGVCAAGIAALSSSALDFTIYDWYLGANQGGLVGEVDSIVMSIGGLPIASNLKDKKVLVSITSFLLIVGIFGVLSYEYRDKWCELNPCGDSGHSRSVNSGMGSAPSKPPNFNTSSSFKKEAPPPKPPSYANNTGTGNSSGLPARPPPNRGPAPPPPRMGNVGNSGGQKLPPPPPKKNLW